MLKRVLASCNQERVFVRESNTLANISYFCFCFLCDRLWCVIRAFGYPTGDFLRCVSFFPLVFFRGIDALCMSFTSRAPGCPRTM